MLNPIRRPGEVTTSHLPASPEPLRTSGGIASEPLGLDRLRSASPSTGGIPATDNITSEPLAASVKSLHAATLGRVGTDEATVLNILTRCHTPAQRQGLQEAFAAKYGRSLESVLQSELSLTYRTRALSLLKTGQEPTDIGSWSYRAEGMLDAVDSLGTVFQDHPVIASLAAGVTLVAAHKYPAATAILNYGLLASSTTRVVVHEVQAANDSSPAARNRHLQQSGHALADVAMTLPGAGPSGLKLVKGGAQTAKTAWQGAAESSMLVRAFRSAKAGAAYRLPVVPAALGTTTPAAAAMGRSEDMGGMARRLLTQYSQHTSPSEMIAQVNKIGQTLGPDKQRALLALLQDPSFVKQSNGERMAKVLMLLGPAHTKLGQIAATTSGLPPEVVAALSKLQDGLEPMGDAMLKERVISAGLADRYAIGKVLGVASMGQVNAATDLKTGEAVVIKFLKPGITHESVTAEFKLMREVLQPALQEMKPVEANEIRSQLNAFERGVLEEMDMTKEASNMQRFATTYADHPDFQGIKMVEIGADNKAIVMSQAPGISFRKIAPQSPEGIKAGSVFLRGFADQVFREGLFHADPHPGNVFWDAEAGKATFLDMGAVAEVTPAQRMQLQKSILYILAKDPDRLAKLTTVSAESIDGSAVKAQAKLAASLRRYLSQPDFNMAKIDDHMKMVDKLAKEAGIHPQEQGFWLQKSIITAYGVFKNISGDPNVLKECLPAVMEGLLKGFRENPGELRQSLMDVAMVLGTRLPTLLQSLQELKVLKPELFVLYPGNFLAAINAITQTTLSADAALTKPPAKPVAGSLNR